MIAKCFASKNPGASSILRLVNYITHDQGKVSRVGGVSVANCHNDDPYMAALEMQNRQEMNTRAKGDKTFHLMLSFRPGETPTPEAMRRIERSVCEGLGYGEHQRVSVVHSDTDSTHIHLAINKIHPQRNTMHCPRFPYKILAAMCKDLEREFSLRVDNHEPGKTVGEDKAQDMERMSGTESLVSWIRRECLGGLRQAASWHECHEILAKHGLDLKPQGAGMVFVSTDGVSVKASTVDRGLSKKRLEDRLGGFVSAVDAANAPSKSAGAELRSGFKARIEAAKAERDAEIAGIKELRDNEIRKAKLEYEASAARAQAAAGRGTRLAELAGASKIYKAQVAAVRRTAKEKLDAVYNARPLDWPTWLKEQAESGSQEAERALQKRAGAGAVKGGVEPAAADGVALPGMVADASAEKPYKKGVPVKSAALGLREEFTARLEALKTERDAGIVRVKERRDMELARLKLECDARIARARASAGRGSRSAEIAGALKIYKASVAVVRRNAKDDVSAAYKAMPRQTWLTWLQEQAKNGRTEAVQSLKSRAYVEAMKITNSIQGEVDNAAGVVIPNQKIDSVTKNGNVIYCVGNDAIKDTGKQLALSREASQDTMIMALRMAQQRFRGPLFVSGSPEYRERVLNAAVAANLRVRFENSDMEAKRRQLIHAKTNTLTNSRTKKGKDME